MPSSPVSFPNRELACVVGAQEGDTLVEAVSSLANSLRFLYRDFPTVQDLDQYLQANPCEGARRLLVVVCLSSIPRDQSATEWIEYLSRARGETCVIAYATEIETSGQLAVSILKAGASDYLAFGISRPSELKNRILKALNGPKYGSPSAALQDQSVFVITPYSAEALEDHELGIKAAISPFARCELASEAYFPTFLSLSVRQQIDDHSLVVANITPYGERDNPNIFYEIGYAHKTGKDVILVRRISANSAVGSSKVPSDIVGLVLIPYANRTDLAVELYKKLTAYRGRARAEAAS